MDVTNMGVKTGVMKYTGAVMRSSHLSSPEWKLYVRGYNSNGAVMREMAQNWYDARPALYRLRIIAKGLL